MLRIKFRPSANLIVLAVAVALLGFSIVSWLAGSGQPASKTAESGVCPNNTICIALTGDKAEPDAVAVAIGATVQFNSADKKTHSLSLGKGGEQHQHTGDYSSGDIKADEGWQVQFKQAGTYTFHDHYQPLLSATVIVYAPNDDPKDPN